MLHFIFSPSCPKKRKVPAGNVTSLPRPLVSCYIYKKRDYEEEGRGDNKSAKGMIPNSYESHHLKNNETNMKLRRLGPIQQKLLLLFFGGLAIGLASNSPKAYFRTVRKVIEAWDDINQRSFNRSLRSLCEMRLLEEIIRPDGTITLRLTENGKRIAKREQFFGNTLKIKRPKKWDRLWRIVMFDIPEKKRVFRDVLRNHLKTIGFKELQHSVFIFPFPCESEMLALTELYNATRYVRIITAQKIDNQEKLENHFFRKSKKC